MRNRLAIVFGAIFVVGIVLYLLGFKLTREDLVISAAAEPITCLGGVREGVHCSKETVLPITNSVIMTVIADLILLGLAFFATRSMQLVPRGLQNAVEYVVESFYNFARGVDAKNVAKFFPIVATIFMFLLVANFTALIPGVGSIGPCVAEEHEKTTATAGEAGAQDAHTTAEGAAAESDDHATTKGPSSAFRSFPLACPSGTHVLPLFRAAAADLNLTLAFALVAMFLVELFGFQALGVGYLTKFFNFSGFKTSVLQGVLDFFIGIVELISELSRILSFSFRLFGNIFAGEVVLAVMAFLFPYLIPLPFWGLELFVAFMQAFIFATLTLVFMSLATQSHAGHEDHGEHGDSHVPYETAAH